MRRKTRFKMGLKGSVLQIGFLSCNKTYYVDVMWTSQQEKSDRNGPRLFVILFEDLHCFQSSGQHANLPLPQMRFFLKRTVFVEVQGNIISIIFPQNTSMFNGCGSFMFK